MPATGSRPDCLAGVRPQERVQQHPVDQIVDTAPALPILGVAVLLMGEQLVDVLRFFNTLCPVAEQVIDVPKISLENIPARRLCRVPQLVEQLVEVPTVLSCSSFLQRTVEQTVDNPASRGDLQGFLPGQGSTASSSHFPDAANEAAVGVFRTISRGKKVRRPQPSRVRSGASEQMNTLAFDCQILAHTHRPLRVTCTNIDTSNIHEHKNMYMWRTSSIDFHRALK